ncbi:MAG: sigma-70 region 4 domain-containing protein [Candidatus Obscuribacter sp.]|nr:sigma-70 region 4 domain-containing protein [Candidatus Obscuribacter sp.]
MRYQFDLSYQDIAQVMHESEANVRNLLFRAKSSLRKLIADSALGLYQSEGIQL